MNKTSMLLAIFAMVVALPAVGQEVRRCYIDGHVVLQEGRCPQSQAVAKDEKLHGRYAVPASGESNHTSDSGDNNPIEVGKVLCRNGAPNAVGLKDDGNIKVGTVLGGQMTTMSIGSASVGVRKFHVPVNARNSYGVYMGEKSLICYTSEDGRRLLKMDNSAF